MIEYKEELEYHQVLHKFKCDKCGYEFEIDSTDDEMELQECAMLRFTGGFNSRTWGDMTRVECDLCQHCLHELLGPYARATPSY